VPPFGEQAGRDRRGLELIIGCHECAAEYRLTRGAGRVEERRRGARAPCAAVLARSGRISNDRGPLGEEISGLMETG